jgi:hypothetical protein
MAHAPHRFNGLLGFLNVLVEIEHRTRFVVAA